MKTRFLIIISLVIMGTIPFGTFPKSFSACIFDEDAGRYLEPCRGLPMPPPPSLKQQIADNVSMFEIKCPNPEHVLTQRPNSSLACVFPETQEKLNWQIVYYIIK
ncbi:MAG: hypothetical protein K5798_10475 [Nitrosopumilus sp.]|uniref:hypothetical protein n=1 Tax=Nitrosopumilus sp. TaxID=2024843 RepID=UPI00242FA03A|nr:hypothetical protein [Nitrosopumilus sp.]MCV0367670.1 hypothetical protein [Nitrosopumilus sp.]